MSQVAVPYGQLFGSNFDRTLSDRRDLHGSRLGPFLIALGLTMATGSVVLFEPAPIDVALIGLLVIGLFFGKLRLTHLHTIPIFFLSWFALANIISLWDPISPLRGLWFGAVTLYLIASMVFFAAVVTSQGKKAVSVILTGYVTAAILNIQLAAGAYFHLIPGQHSLLLYGRPKGLFKDPNVYGPYIVPVATLALSRVLTKSLPLKQRLLWCVLLGISIAGIFLSFSRACWLNCAISIILLAVFLILQSDDLKQSLRKLAVIAGIIVLSGMLLYVVSTIPAVSAMLKIRLGNRGLQNYDKMRFHTHSLAVKALIDRPLGIGPGQTELAFNYSTHSTYLRVLSENGIMGGISLFTLFGLTLYRSTRLAFTLRNTYWKSFFTVVAVSLAGQLANCVVIDSLHWRHLWLFLGLAWVVPETE